MKIKIKESELKECIKNAVVRAVNEQKISLKEYYDDDDEDDSVSRFLKDKRNQLPKRMKGGAAARKAAMADIKKEMDAENRDNKAAEDREEKEMHGED